MPDRPKYNFRFFILLFFVFLSIIYTQPTRAQEEINSNYIVHIYFFRGDGCSHCAKAEPFLQSLAEKYGADRVVIHEFELWHHVENVPIVDAFVAAYNIEFSGVPMTFIGKAYFIGFNEEIGAQIEAAVIEGLKNGAPNPQDIVDGKEILEAPQLPLSAVIDVPFFGKVDLEKESLLISTIIIGLVDGVNPCSLWVLTMLLAMVVHTNSRKKTLIIGFVFLTVTAGIYALFILGVFTVLSYASYLKWIRIIIACVTLIMGLINLKDYFFFKQGVSLSIDDAKKPGLYKKMRKVMNSSENIGAMIGATIALSVGVSLIEFSCTAAFPVVWSNLLVAHNTPKLTFFLLLLLYMALYQLDEMIIFLVAAFTMKSSKMEEKHGQILKLFSGCLMVVLSAVMIINPALMNELGNTLLIFGIAIAITLFILLLASVILPRFGIYIGHNKPVKKS